jgi:hypothetical protein
MTLRQTPIPLAKSGPEAILGTLRFSLHKVLYLQMG